MKEIILTTLFVFLLIPQLYCEELIEHEGNLLLKTENILDKEIYYYEKYVVEIEDNNITILINNGEVHPFFELKSLEKLKTITIEDNFFFLGLWEDLMLIDLGTAPGIRRLYIYDFTNKRGTFKGYYLSQYLNFNRNKISLIDSRSENHFTDKSDLDVSFHDLEQALRWVKEGGEILILQEIIFELDTYKTYTTDKAFFLLR